MKFDIQLQLLDKPGGCEGVPSLLLLQPGALRAGMINKNKGNTELPKPNTDTKYSQKWPNKEAKNRYRYWPREQSVYP